MIVAESNTRPDVKKIVAGVDGLKPLPANVIRALKLLDEPDVNIREIVSVIAVDQALAARILRMANSAYYGFRYPATTLYEAVTRLGFRRTKRVLFSVSYSSSLGRRVAGYGLGRGELWKHSVAVAMTAQRLSERVLYPAPDEAYLAGLLHDIGKLVLDQRFRLNWDKLLETAQKKELMLVEVEQLLLGINHALVGGVLAQQWSLPLVLIEAITYHHAPALATKAPALAAIIHIADFICLQAGAGLAHATFLPAPEQPSLEILSLDECEVELIAEQYAEMLDSLPIFEDII